MRAHRFLTVSRLPPAVIHLLALTLALVFTLGSPLARSQTFDRLFTNPQEREYLDFLRREWVEQNATAGFNIEDTALPQIPQAAAEPDPILNLGGILDRRDGGRTIWLNGSAIAESELPAHMRTTLAGGTRALQVRINGTNLVIKPGQSLNLNSGEMWDSFEGRGPSVADPRPAPAAVEPEAFTPAAADSAGDAEANEADNPGSTDDQGAAFLRDFLQALQNLQPDQGR
jgi:hypothetical protein